MKIQQKTYRGQWDDASPWRYSAAQLVLAFGSPELLSGPPMTQVKQAHPNAQIVGCSTAGEIFGSTVLDDSLTVTAVCFSDTGIQAAETVLQDATDSSEAGRRLAAALPTAGLVHVLVISDGLQVNGSELVKGMTELLPAKVAITGGLSGDGARFQKTLVYFNGNACERRIVAIGLYGKQLRVGYGSLGGWDPFGPERIVTRSIGNVLYELDGKSALALYKKYLGPHAAGLPASGLRFPLTMWSNANDTPVVRTILAVDEKKQSMTFAGDVPQGMKVRLMRANFDRLIGGASGAAQCSQNALGAVPELAILISCVGRKLILQQRTEEEVESVRAVVGDRAVMTGFYSYGEISPFTASARCELHNQTMTITTFSEAA
jgi:hypothetical protein